MDIAAAHLIGIGGSGMSAIAEMLLERGVKVSGSDAVLSALTETLQLHGAVVFQGHKAEHLAADVALVVHSAAIAEDNPELRLARQRGLRVMKYAEMLGELMRGARAICVSGCHGKTTTSSMIAHMFLSCGQDPSFVIGGVVRGVNRSSRAGKGPYFVAEACEYDRSFHHLHPQVAVITNIDADHLDYYKDLDKIEEAFSVFASLTPERNGLVVVPAEDVRARRAAEKSGRPVVTFGLAAGCDYAARDVQSNANGISFRAFARGTDLGAFHARQYGLHNVKNALAMLAVGDFFGIPAAQMRAAFASFEGVGRRFEWVGEVGGMLVFDDYGHHPTEVAAVIAAARERFPEKQIWLAFQPHQHARTRVMMDEFARVLKQADMTILLDIYAARDTEEDRRIVHSSQLAKRLASVGGTVQYCGTFDEAVGFARLHASPDKVLITAGAGDVWKLAYTLVGR